MAQNIACSRVLLCSVSNSMHADALPVKAIDQEDIFFVKCIQKAPRASACTFGARRCSSFLVAMRGRKLGFLSALFHSVFKRLQAFFGFHQNSGTKRFFAEFDQNAANFSNSPLWHARLFLSTCLRNQPNIVNSREDQFEVF